MSFLFQKSKKFRLVWMLVAMLVLALSLALFAACDSGGSTGTTGGTTDEEPDKRPDPTPDPTPDPDKDTCEHQYREVPAVPAQCEEQGNILYYICDLCGKFFDANHSEIDEEDTVLEATGHTRGEVVAVQAPTCGEDGFGYVECSVCHVPLEENVPIAATGEHTLPDEWYVERAPSCTQKGSRVKNCTVCGHEMQREEMEMTPHTPGSPIRDEDPTCTTAGRSHTECTVCHTVVERTEIPAAGHSITEYFEKQDAACGVAGNEAYWSCDKCGQKFSDQAGDQELSDEDIVIEALEHKYGAGWSSDFNRHWKTCELCGEAGEKVSHTFVDELYCECGVVPGYELVDGDHWALKQYPSDGRVNWGKDVSIPAEILGHPVTEIGRSNQSVQLVGVESLSIPDSVTVIHMNALSNSNGLKKLYIGSGLKTVDYGAFSMCPDITDIYLKDLKVWCEIDFDDAAASSPLYTVYDQNKNASTPKLVNFHLGWESEGGMTKADIPQGTARIAKCAFLGTSITEAVLPDSVESIGENAFRGCRSLKTFTFGAGVKRVGFDAFAGCGITAVHMNSLKAWCEADLSNVGGANPVYRGSEVAQIYYQGKLLSEIKEEDLAGVKNIPQYRFHGCESLTSVTIPRGATVGEYAFMNCPKLKTVTAIGAEAIGSNAFMNCKFLESVDLDAKEIGAAFSGCTEILSITFGDSVQRVGSMAFRDSTKVTTVTFGECEGIVLPLFLSGGSVTKVRIPSLKLWCSIQENGIGNLRGENTSLYLIGGEGEDTLVEGKIELPAGITQISAYAFSGMQGITEVVIPDGVESIGNYAFSGVKNIAAMDLPASVKSIGSYAFYDASVKTITGGLGIESVGDHAFAGPNDSLPNKINGSKLEIFPFGDSLKEIGEYAFAGSALRAAENLNAETISKHAFASCESLAAVSFGEKVRLIDDGAFTRCIALKELVIPATVNTVSYSAFEYCSGLETVEIDAENVFDNAFTGAFRTGRDPWETEGITTKLTVGEHVKHFYPDAFNFVGTRLNELHIKSLKAWLSIQFDDVGLSGSANPMNGATQSNIYHAVFVGERELTALTAADLAGVTSISGFAFYGFTSLKSVTLSDTVTSIGDGAFYYCTNLEIVTVPATVKKIGGYAFGNCNRLTTFILLTKDAEIGYSPFDDCGSLTTLYYGGSEAEWTEQGYADIIQKYNGPAITVYYFSGEENADGRHWHWSSDTPAIW